MKRLVKNTRLNSVIAILIISGGILTLLDVAEAPPSIVSVYAESETGYSWVRTYRGPQHRLDAFVASLNDSYHRLSESMGASSSLKVFVKGVLIDESDYKGTAKSSFSGIQIAVHDMFALKYGFETNDEVPGFLSEMDNPIEPFVCDKK